MQGAPIERRLPRREVARLGGVPPRAALINLLPRDSPRPLGVCVVNDETDERAARRRAQGRATLLLFGPGGGRLILDRGDKREGLVLGWRLRGGYDGAGRAVGFEGDGAERRHHEFRETGLWVVPAAHALENGATGALSLWEAAHEEHSADGYGPRVEFNHLVVVESRQHS